MSTTDPLKAHGRRANAPITEKLASTQVPNSTGGYVFAVDEMQRALRFLILGTTGGTYYASEKAITSENAEFIKNLADNRGVELVELIRDVSLNGRAARQNQTLFALALCASSTDAETRKSALGNLNAICRTFTMLSQFLGYL